MRYAPIFSLAWRHLFAAIVASLLAVGCNGGHKLDLSVEPNPIVRSSGHAVIRIAGASATAVRVFTTAGKVGQAQKNGNAVTASLSGVGGQTRFVTVEARDGNAIATLVVPVVDGVGNGLILKPVSRFVNADSGSAQVDVLLVDALGNPVDSDTPKVSSSAGNVVGAVKIAPGVFRVTIDGLHDTAQSPVQISASLNDLSAVGTVTILAGAADKYDIQLARRP